MKNLKRIIAIIITILLAFAYGHIAKPNNIYDKTVDNSKYLGTGITQGTVEQSFVCTEDTLDGVKVKTQIVGDVHGINVKYSLVDVEANKVVGEGKADATSIKASKFYNYSFDTVKNCKGKTYKIIFENVGSTETAGVGFFFQPTTEKNTELTISDNHTEGTLILKTITNRFDFETFAVLLIFIQYIVVFMKFLYRLFK